MMLKWLFEHGISPQQELLARTIQTGRLASNCHGTARADILVLDVARIRGTPHQVEALILSTARRDGPKVTVAIPEDPGQAGKSQCPT